MIRKILLSFCFTLLILGLAAQSLVNSTPERAGFSSERLQRMDSHIQKYVNEGKLPGGVFALARHGQIVYFKSFGNDSPGRIYKNDDIFRLASMTKAVTTVAVMQLYEQGKLGLDDPIHYYIPAFAEMTVVDSFNVVDSSYTTVPAKNKISIRQLLTHTSGIVYGDFDPNKMGIVYADHEMRGVGLYHDTWSTEELVNRLAAIPLAFEPGTQWTYGLNMEVLGRIVEVVSGQKLNDYFKEHIFDPLGITDTWFQLPADQKSRLVSVYAYDKEGKLTIPEVTTTPGTNVNYPLYPDNNHYAGGGGLSGTTLDYLTFIQALLNEGRYNGHQLLGRKTVETMRSDQLISQNANGKGISKMPGITFNLGFALLTDPGEGYNAKSVGTYEWGGYFNTKYFIDPKEDLVFVGMTQIVPFRNPEFWDRLYAILYAALENE